MRREDLIRSIQAASLVTAQPGVIVIGSQSILASFDESQIPDVVTFSEEADILPLTEDAKENLSDKIDAHLGEWSEFHLKNEFYVQGVDRTTAVLPAGWEERLVELPAGDVTGYCLEPYDLCIAKLVANREKDIAYVTALIDAGIIDPEQLFLRSTLLDTDLATEKIRIQSWITYMTGRKFSPTAPRG